MQEVEKTVDIDTSGPDTEVELNQEDTSDTTAVESTVSPNRPHLIISTLLFVFFII